MSALGVAVELPFQIVRNRATSAAVRQLQIALRTFKRLDMGLLIDRQHKGIVGGSRYSLMILAAFDALAPRLAPAKIDPLSPQKPPNNCTSASPSAAAISGSEQNSQARGQRVARILSASLGGEFGLGAPLTVSSKPASRWLANRTRHLLAVPIVQGTARQSPAWPPRPPRAAQCVPAGAADAPFRSLLTLLRRQFERRRYLGWWQAAWRLYAGGRRDWQSPQGVPRPRFPALRCASHELRQARRQGRGDEHVGAIPRSIQQSVRTTLAMGTADTDVPAIRCRATTKIRPTVASDKMTSRWRSACATRRLPHQSG